MCAGAFGERCVAYSNTPQTPPSYNKQTNMCDQNASPSLHTSETSLTETSPSGLAFFRSWISCARSYSVLIGWWVGGSD